MKYVETESVELKRNLNEHFEKEIVVDIYGEKAYEFTKDSITVTIPFDKEKCDSNKKFTTQKTTQKIAKTTREKIIKIFIENPNISRNELSKLLEITSDGVRYHLNKLIKENKIKHVGPKKGGHWEVIE